MGPSCHCLLIGFGGLYLGAAAGVELIYGPNKSWGKHSNLK